MNRMEEAKRKYEEIPIPEELSQRVMSEIEKADERRRRAACARYRAVRAGVLTAATIAIAFTAAVNTSTAFAKSVSSIPVIGAMARVLTFRSYETDELKISVEIPSIDMIDKDFKGLEESVNQEIHSLCEQYAGEAAEEYRQAFLDTGGTAEEWARHGIEIRVWYEVKSQTEKYLSLAITGTENWTDAYTETRYYNFDLEKRTLITLEEVLGEAYAQTAEKSVRRQMEEREAEGMEYWDSFEGIDENTKFYMNEAGHPVIVFDKYEVAPGAAGQQEFEIVEP